jgi:alpha-amylase
VRNCELSGLKDLLGGGSWVQNRQVQFLNKLIDYGVAGFRIDAAKHMWVEDIAILLGQLNNLSTSHGFPAGARPFIYQEVIDQGGEAIKGDEYFGNGRVTEFKASISLGQVFNGFTQLRHLVDWGLPKGDGTIGWGLYPSINSLTFVDNHDNQRGHGAGGKNILTYHNSRQYKMATAFKLAWPYSTTRIMSSYFFDRDTQTEMGPPNTNGFTNGVIIKPDGTCDGGWVCEHRWRQIFNMVEFRNVVDGTNMNDWWADEIGGNKIAFCRGDKGFVAMNNDNSPMTRTFQTCLVPGRYCDVISGSLNGTSCTDGGKIITVAPFGWADITISNEDLDPVVAIHANSRLP